MQLNIDAKEARLRLLLSSDVIPSYVGSYASAGSPVVDRLFRKSGAFAVKTDGTTESVTATANSSLSYSDGQINPTIYFGRGGSPYFCGLQVIENRVFIFTTSDMRWKEVHPTSIHLELQTDTGVKTIQSISEFQTYWRGLSVM